ncbi:MAG TPA: leucyl aminopeptidase family protein [Steroidobacteraceae bacterium]|jgi:leucyl aminopeptidase
MTSNASLPLWLLFEDEVDAWRATQSEAVRRWLSEQGFKGERHRVALLPGADGALQSAVGGLGKRQGELSVWHGAGFAERLPARRFHLAQEFSARDATQLALGFAYGLYRFERYRAVKHEAAHLELPANADARYVSNAAESLRMARDWINTPAGDFGPKELAQAARQIAERHRASFREWCGEELLQDNFPAIHAVGRAAGEPPRLLQLRWSPSAAAPLPTVALVGKGVCFDSGGLDIKPAAGMLLMKKDMGGAAVTLALANMLMGARLKANLHVLIPAVENAISGNAYRPGDVLATRKGLSVEVGNTDAEGRLVLCDALALADAERPDFIADFATLTGAARVALGPELPALFGNDDAVVEDLARIAVQQHDPLWPMPLWAAYEDELSSKIADLNNVSASSFAGAIFGALFLKRFVTECTRWVHIDLYAWNPKDRPGRGVGAEPQAVRALYHYLIDRYGTES